MQLSFQDLGQIAGKVIKREALGGFLQPHLEHPVSGMTTPNKTFLPVQGVVGY